PVGYAREGDRVAVVTSPAYRWWRNVVEPAAVQVRLDGRWHEGVARLVPVDDPIYDEVVALQVRKRGPQMLRTFGVEVTDDGRIASEVRAKASDHAHLVLIELGDPIDRPG
ncbi:MAG: nitroreductase/quinone reductase family protein, partial [Candidatus Limnocylindrales bacterium]